MNNKDFTVIDFETANNSRNSICQIGICRIENGKTIYSKSFLVQPPGNEYSNWNVGIHGISPDITHNEPFFSEIWKEIKDYFENQLIVAHNAEFDLDCLYKTLEYYGLECPCFQSECTYKLTGLNLIDLVESLDIKLMPHHNALNDSLMCAESYMKLINGHKPNMQKITKKELKSFFEGHEKLSGKVLKPDLKQSDSSSPFYGKKVVFTGVLSVIGREEAAEIVKKMGADIDTAISKKTNFVIIGTGAGPSKLKKINEYNRTGSIISMIYETEFLEIIKQSL